ncbi:unnamed protein product [Calicophoron daubneyi]|uniref:Rap-GAP domain-containing protein n=1 Tax=Calicophoron daubneyi TaxID=300641 RepID=A0AAV2TGE9_CALDB
MYTDWSPDFDQICSKVLEHESFLRMFASDTATSISRGIVLSIKCDCSCSLVPASAETVMHLSELERNAPTSDLGGSSGFSSSAKESKDVTQGTASMRIAGLSVSGSVQLDTSNEVRWAMPMITYGLTMSADYWDVTKHSAHIYCSWLRNLTSVSRPSTQGMIQNSSVPMVIRREPMRYLEPILFSLAYFFFPRSPEPFHDRLRWFISSLGQSVSVSPTKSVEENSDSTENQQTTDSDYSMSSVTLNRQLDVTRQIVQAVEAVTSSPQLLPPDAWDSLLQFCLVICHAVLAMPLPVPPQLLRSPSQPHPSTNLAGLVVPGSSATQSGEASLSSSASLTISSNVDIRNTSSDPICLAENIADCVFSLLVSTWLKACTYCFPRPQMWAALRECVKVWRHQNVVVAHWSRILVAFTGQILGHIYGPDYSLSGSDPSGVSILPREMPIESVREAWFRVLYLLGNPVDMCDPHVIATPVLEEVRKTAASLRVGWASIHLPYIYHQALRALSVVVDGFLGIRPSLSVGIEASLGIPSDFYGMLGSLSTKVGLRATDVTETEVKQPVAVASMSGPQFTQRSSAIGPVMEKSSSRKLRLAGVVTSAGLLASSGGSAIRQSPEPQSAASGMAQPTLSALASGLNTAPSTFSAGFGGVSTAKSHSPHSGPSGSNSASVQAMQQTLLQMCGRSSIGFQQPRVRNLYNLATYWLGPEPNQAVCGQCPQANSLLQLVGSWLFEASVTGADKELNIAVITCKVDQFPKYLSFEAGRAEALGALCRIMIYAKRGQLAKEFLTRFYLCIYYGLETEHGRSDLALSSVLFYGIDLLRVDLPGINILLPRLFPACQFVLQNDNLRKPDFLTNVLLRRAAIHQLMAMVCIPVQFKGATIRCLVPVLKVMKDPLSLNDLKGQLGVFLRDTLEREKDEINLQMLLSASLALLEDMSVDEAVSPSDSSVTRPGDEIRRNLTASTYFNILVPCLCNLLVKEWESNSSVVQYLLEVISGVAAVRIQMPDPIIYRETVRQLCEFITNQCRRNWKDHKRQLHSIIVAAYSCLTIWLVEHAAILLNDPLCLQTVLGTIELGICGSKSKGDAQSSLAPSLKSKKLMAPSSKRVRNAAESCLATFLSLAGSFPGPTGSDTTCSCLIEDQLVKLISPEDAGQLPNVLKSLRSQFRYFWSEPGVILGLLEISQCRDILVQQGIIHDQTLFYSLPETVLIVRGPFGRHVWAVRMRHLPLEDPDSAGSPSGRTRPSRPKPWGCFLDRLLKTIKLNETIQPLTFPASIKDIPLVDADHATGSLEQVGGLPGTQSRKEIDHFKSLIASQSAHMEEISHRWLRDRMNTPCPDPSIDISPPSVRTSFQSARLLLSHLGYLSVNTFSMIGPDPTPNTAATVMKSDPILTVGASGLGDSLNLGASQGSIPPGTFPPPAMSPTGPGLPIVSSENDPSLQPCPTLFPLDGGSPDFSRLLESIDSLPTRTADTMLVFYVAAGQTEPEAILSNMKSWNQLPKEFHQFLHGIGSFVEIEKHSGWTGRLETSYHPISSELGSNGTTSKSVPHIDSPPDGSRFVVYAANSVTELACICPSDFTMAIAVDEAKSATKPFISRSLTEPNNGVTTSSAGQSTAAPLNTDGEADPTGGRVAVVWLERWIDGPITSTTDCSGWSLQHLTNQLFGCSVTIYVHQLSSKLYRIGMIRAVGKAFEAGPIQNGLVLSSRCLSSFVRQTVENIAQRRRLASDQFQPPHIKRNHRVFELGQTCRQRPTAQPVNQTAISSYCPDILVGLFTAPSG